MRKKIEFILAMTIYGTIGILRKWIPVPSSVLALARASIGMVFLIVVILITGKKISIQSVAKNIKPLLIAGVLLGFNWILLFEAYNYTTVATATLCYYMAPILMMIASKIFYNEKISVIKWVCIAVALIGMIFVTGVAEGGFTGHKGIILGLSAAVLYTAIVMVNKKLCDITSYDKTVIQLFVSAVVLMPYVLLTENVSAISWTPMCIILVAVAGIVHTGVAYTLYFGAIGELPTNEVAILSYIDPILAVILSAVLLHETMTPIATVGTVMVIISLIVSEMDT